jgi:hypothetical protein
MRSRLRRNFPYGRHWAGVSFEEHRFYTERRAMGQSKMLKEWRELRGLEIEDLAAAIGEPS